MNIDTINLFQYWGQGLANMPGMIKQIYENNLEICRKYKINLVLIDDVNVYDYIIPHYKFTSLAYNFKSDIVRYYILHKYGGFWLDTDVIIIKDLTILYETICKYNYECMLDVEYGTKIGCCSLFIKKNSNVSRFCINYINDVLYRFNNGYPLDWGDIGPDTVEQLYKIHSNVILLNNYDTVKNGANFICWNETPGVNKEKWFLDTEEKAMKKAYELNNNTACYYLVTWTIYRQNNIEGNLCDFIFKNKRSVFSYFVDTKTIVKIKYAVIWASTINIGDDIQTLAAINFLKIKGITDYICIHREKLSDYEGEPITLIMNGWFMHNIHKFPPSDNITPIFISFHVDNEDLISNNITYFKKYQPIGCRDEATVNLFKKYEIEAYFTGCLTLLFDDVKEKTGGKYLVDVNTKCNYIPNIEFDNSKYKDYEIIEHDINYYSFITSIPLEKRIEMANKLLDKYRNAELVITTRLHCILPCRAFNTDAIFIHKEYTNNPRFMGLKKIINGDSKINDKKSRNREEIEKIRNKLMTQYTI